MRSSQGDVMIDPTKTIPLERYGLAREEMDLPDGLDEELDSSWAAFVEKRAKANVLQTLGLHENGAVERMLDWLHVQFQGRGHFEGLGIFVGGFVACWVLLICFIDALVLYRFIADADVNLGDLHIDALDIEPGLLIISILVNPLYWAWFSNARAKRGDWAASMFLIVVVGAMFLALEAHDGFSFSDGETNAYWVSLFLLLLPTRLAWLWKKSFRAELAAQRERVAKDDAAMLVFLDEAASTLWGERLVASNERHKELAAQIQQGRVFLEQLQRRDGIDGSTTAMKLMAIKQDLDESTRTYDRIVFLQKRVTLIRQQLCGPDAEIRSVLRQRMENRSIDDWQRQLSQTRSNSTP